MRPPTELSTMATGLVHLAESDVVRLAVVVYLPSGSSDFDARVAPAEILEDEESFWRALTGPIRAGLREVGAMCAGLLLPATFVGGALEPCEPSRADVLAVVGAQRVPGGAVSVAYYAQVGDAPLDWKEASDEAAWILTPLRGFVAADPLEIGESALSV